MINNNLKSHTVTTRRFEKGARMKDSVCLFECEIDDCGEWENHRFTKDSVCIMLWSKTYSQGRIIEITCLNSENGIDFTLESSRCSYYDDKAQTIRDITVEIDSEIGVRKSESKSFFKDGKLVRIDNIEYMFCKHPIEVSNEYQTLYFYKEDILIEKKEIISGEEFAKILYTYNSNNLVIKEKDFRNGKLYHTTEYDYHFNGNLKGKISKFSERGREFEIYYFNEENDLIEEKLYSGKPSYLYSEYKYVIDKKQEADRETIVTKKILTKQIRVKEAKHIEQDIVKNLEWITKNEIIEEVMIENVYRMVNKFPSKQL